MNEAEWSKWIEWKGGECPVDGGETVRVLRQGQIVEHETQARNMRWVHLGSGYDDIVAYRVKRTQAEKAETGIDATLAERGARYGEFDEHARITQQIKSALVSGRSWSQCTPSQKECLEMLAHKMGRIVNGDPTYLDSWVDIIGYTRLVEKQMEGGNV